MLGPPGAVAVINSDLGTGIRMAAPLAMLSTLALCAQRSVLVKDGRALELLCEVDTVLFDKTGTLTRERPEVGQIIGANGLNPLQILRFTAAAEQRFHHPVALAILQNAADEGRLPPTDATHAKYPAFTLMAEVYWNLEWTLQQQGFDYCYDKRLYDRLRDGHAGPIREHLLAGLDYQGKLARFLENHDEPRAASEFPWPQHQAAAIITFLSPGLRFFYDGQFEGARVWLPTHLCRGPIEPTNPEIAAFYSKLLQVLKETSAFRNGGWSQRQPQPAWPGWTSDGFVAYAWAGGHNVVVVNYSGNQGQCRLQLPFPEFRGKQLRLTDAMGSEVYNRDGSDLVDHGLYIKHSPWQFNVFTLQAN